MLRRKHTWMMATIAIGVLLAIAALPGCSDIEEALTTDDGTVTVNIHDQSTDDIAEAHVQFSAIEMRNSETGLWQMVSNEGIPSIELLVLVNGNEATLAAAPIPPGSYDGMRLWFESIRVVLTTGDSIDVPAPSQPVSVTGFGVVAIGEGGNATITLDFPVDTSFSVNGTAVTVTPSILLDTAFSN